MVGQYRLVVALNPLTDFLEACFSRRWVTPR
jgi:hypothetical protein